MLSAPPSQQHHHHHIHHHHPSFLPLTKPQHIHSTMSSYSLPSFSLALFTSDLISSLATLTNSALDGAVGALFTYYTHRADTEVQDLNRTMSSLHAKNLELRHQLLQHQIQNGQTISELRAEKMELSQQVQVLQAQLQTEDWTMISELRAEMERLRGELRERDVKIVGLEEKYDRLVRERRGKVWGMVRSGLCAGM